MNEQKMLSVIIPVYKVEAYLEKCVNSVRNQTYKNIEIILVDDGSPDNCPEICDRLAKEDDRITVIHKQNGGQGSARNMGLDIAKGSYIAFIDSDDYVDENMYEIMIEALERTNSDMSFCGFYSHSGLRIAESTKIKHEHIWENAEQLLEALFKGEAVGSPCNKVCKSEIFSDIRFPEGVAREDIYIMHTLYGKCKRAVHTGKSFYHYLIREGSSEHQDFDPKYLISIQIAEDRRDYISKNFPNLLPYADHSCFGARLSAIKKIVRSDCEKAFSDTLAELKDYIRDNQADTKEYKKLRREILYFPFVYKIRMNLQYKWRKKAKALLTKLRFRKGNESK